MLCFRKEERKTVGRRAPAGNLGIFCVSRIFEVIPRYVRTNITVSPERARRKRARKTRLAVLGTGNSRECSRKCVFSFLFAKIRCQKSECMRCSQKKWSKKPSRPKRAEGGQASACRQTKGIFCESRIFRVTPIYVCINISVSLCRVRGVPRKKRIQS